MDANLMIPKLYGMENITTEEVMDKLDMFQERFVKVDELGWWYIDRIQTDSYMQIAPKEFQEIFSVCLVRLALATPDHQEMNGQVEVTWWTFWTISHSIMVHTQVSGEYIHFLLM